MSAFVLAVLLMLLTPALRAAPFDPLDSAAIEPKLGVASRET